MDEAHNSEGGGSRRSFSGMFSGILSKQLSMDTDTSDRCRKNAAFGGKVKPGYGAKHLLARTSSGAGDLHTAPESPLASTLAASSPSAEWVAAGQDAAVNQSWPGGTPHLQTTPTRGLFSKLLSKKKFKAAHSPASNRSPSLGTSSRNSESPSSHSAEHYSCIAEAAAVPATPPCKQRGQDGLDSVYSTPMGPGAMQSFLPAYSDFSGEETIDLHQVMQQDLPDVFTPGFSELLGNAAGKACAVNPTQDSNIEEPTIMLVSGAQLAQAGQMYDASSMLFATQSTGGSATAEAPPSSAEHTEAVEGCQDMQQSQHVAMHIDEAAQPADAAADDALLEESQEKPSASAKVAALQNQPQPGSVEAEYPAERLDAVVALSSPTANGARALSEEPPAAENCQSLASHDCDQPAVDTPCDGAIAAAVPDHGQLLSASVDTSDELAQHDTSEQQSSINAQAAWPELEPSVVDVPADALPSEHVELESANAVGETGKTVGTTPEQRLGAAEVPASVHNTAIAADVCVSEEGTVVADADGSCVSQHELQSVGQAATVTANESLKVDVAASPVTAAALVLDQTLTTADSVKETPEAMTDVADAQGTAVLDTAAETQPADERSELQQTASQAKLRQQQQYAVNPDHAVSGSDVSSHDSPQLYKAMDDQLPEEFPTATESAAPVDDELVEDQGCQPTAAVHRMSDEQSDSSPQEEGLQTAVLDPAAGAASPSQVSDTDEAVPLPIPGDDEGMECDEPGSHISSVQAAAAAPPPLSDISPVHQPVVSSPLKSSSGSKCRQSPVDPVRESMPLFLADPSKAMGSPLALEEEGLDDQDMQQIIERSAQQLAASQKTSLLTRGGPQRVAVGSVGGMGFSSLEPVAEASFNSTESPSSERSQNFSGSDAGATSSRQLDLNQDMSPMQPRRLSNSPQGTPAAAQPVSCGSPNLGGTPGSVYSTPTLAFNMGTRTGQGTETPHSGLTNISVGSAIRQITPVVGGLDLSSAMHDLPEPSPTLVLMPGAAGLSDTPSALQAAGDGTTPSLLDARAASPSAVYATRFMATPFRGALAALPMDAALAAPLVDSSPFQLSDCGMDTVCLADEAQRVAANLAIAASGFAATPVRTSAVSIPQTAASPASAASQGRTAAAAASPTEELRDLHVVMLTKQLAEVQKKMKDLEGENLRLKEQVEIYEFEKTELNSQEEMEKQARQYAEEQLEDMRVEMQKLMQANNAQAQQMLSMQQEHQYQQQEAQTRFDALQQQHAQLAHTIGQLQDERNQVLDKLNLVDMQVTALKSSNADLSAAVEAEQQRCAELEAALAARDRDLAEAGRCSIESQARLEKMMEQLIAANTAKEHARQKAADEASRLQQVMNERQQLLAERQTVVMERDKYVALKRKYNQKSQTLQEVEQKLQAKEAENQELMAMCDQLLQQQEARRQ